VLETIGTTLVELIEDETALELEEALGDTKEDETDVLAACVLDMVDGNICELAVSSTGPREDETDMLAACEFGTEKETAIELEAILIGLREDETDVPAACEFDIDEEIAGETVDRKKRHGQCISCRA
jgi:hypothetical protein